jgi:hypothetical protein
VRDGLRRAEKALQQVDASERRRRPECERRDAVRRDQLGGLDGAVVQRRLERCQPARRVRCRVGAGLEQHPHQLGAVETGGEVERPFELRPGLDQQFHRAWIDAEPGAEVVAHGVGLRHRLEQRRPGALVHLSRQSGVLVEERAQSVDVTAADCLERGDHFRRALALALVLGADALDGRCELAPGLEAIFASDHYPWVFEPARHVRRGAAKRLLVAFGDTRRELLRPTLVERHGPKPDARDRPFGLRRFRSPLEVRPGPVAVLDRHDVLGVAETEALIRALAQHRRCACRRLLVTRAKGTDERLRILPVSLEIHDRSLPRARRPLARAEERSSARLPVVHVSEVGASLPADWMRPRAHWKSTGA